MLDRLIMKLNDFSELLAMLWVICLFSSCSFSKSSNSPFVNHHSGFRCFWWVILNLIERRMFRLHKLCTLTMVCLEILDWNTKLHTSVTEENQMLNCFLHFKLCTSKFIPILLIHLENSGQSICEKELHYSFFPSLHSTD